MRAYSVAEKCPADVFIHNTNKDIPTSSFGNQQQCLILSVREVAQIDQQSKVHCHFIVYLGKGLLLRKIGMRCGPRPSDGQPVTTRNGRLT